MHGLILISYTEYRILFLFEGLDPTSNTGACYDSPPPPSTLKTTREVSKMSNVHTTLFQNSFVLVS